MVDAVPVLDLHGQNELCMVAGVLEGTLLDLLELRLYVLKPPRMKNITRADKCQTLEPSLLCDGVDDHAARGCPRITTVDMQVYRVSLEFRQSVTYPKLTTSFLKHCTHQHKIEDLQKILSGGGSHFYIAEVEGKIV